MCYNRSNLSKFQCCKSFSAKETLNRHNKTHTGNSAVLEVAQTLTEFDSTAETASISQKYETDLSFFNFAYFAI